jgi:hypothetical protein
VCVCVCARGAPDGIKKLQLSRKLGTVRFILSLDDASADKKRHDTVAGVSCVQVASWSVRGGDTYVTRREAFVNPDACSFNM